MTSYRQIISDHIQDYSGRVVDSPGDNILAEFRSSVDAVQCAVEKAIRLQPNPPTWYIGHMMSAYYWVDQYEDSLRMAKRLIDESKKAENWLFVSWGYWGSARAHIRVGKESEAREDVANLLKIFPDSNLDEERRISSYKTGVNEREYEDLRKAGFPEHAPLPLPAKPSIAVLPFDNLSDVPEQEYFIDGIAEDIITALSKREGSIMAKQLAKEALMLDPNYAFPYATLANAHMLDVWFGYSESREESMRIAAEAVQKALSLDPSDPKVYHAVTNLYCMQGQYEKAISAAEYGIKIGPHNAEAYFSMGNAMMIFYKNKEAIPFYEQAIRLDPYPSSVIYRALGSAYMGVGRSPLSLFSLWII